MIRKGLLYQCLAVVELAVDGDDPAFADAFPGHCHKAGIDCVSLSPTEARELEPALSEKAFAVYQVPDASVDPFRLTLANVHHARELTASRYLPHTEVSCASCHEQNYGNMIRADHLSQGQINGFPVYRLKNAKLNTVHGRFKGCVRDTRAESYAKGGPEFKALELYVASRGNGLSVEGPSVRN